MKWLWFTGLWTYPLIAWFSYFVTGELDMPVMVRNILVYAVPLIFPAFITWTNIERKQRGQTDFSFGATYGLAAKDERHSKAYLDAAYPEIPREYSSKIPTGLVLGKHKGKYAYCPIKSDGINAYICGVPGSGKSVLILGWLYSMMFRNEIARKGHSNPGKPFNYFLVDIKGELFERVLGIKAQDYKAEEHKDFQVIAPAVPTSYGYDVFYKIHREDVTETEIIKAVTDIADALVVATGDNPYFSDNAKKILSGALYYFAKQGYDFLPIIQTLMRTGLDELLTAIVADAENQNMGVVLDKLKGFVGKGDNESVADIETTLKSYLEVFSYPELQWVLHDNPNKTSPAVLNDGKTNLDLAIHESMLVTYQPFFRLVTMQMLRHCESEFSEYDNRYTMLIFDEAARIGQINGLDAAMSTLRSMIYEPASYKRTLREVVTDADGNPLYDEDGNKITQAVERTFPSFKVGYVFAYEDTSGKPLPSIVSILDRDVDNFDSVMDALRKISPAPIRFDSVDGGANGYYDLVKREIVVKDTLPQAQKIKTAVHEVAHSILHDKIDGLDLEANKREMEVSAESVAFVVCSWLGLDTSEYSFGYVGGWSAGKELKELQQKMEKIRTTASMIISGLDGELRPQQVIVPEEIEEEREMLQSVTVVAVQKEKPQKTISHRRR